MTALVTLHHPHGQIYGYPFIPTRFERAATRARRHLERTGECLQCSLLARELCRDERIVSQSAEWIAYVPFAARWPYQVRLVPRSHVPDLPALDDGLRDDLAVIYGDVLRRFDGLFDAPAPYVASWQQAPTYRDRHSWHLGAEIFTIRRASDKLKYLAGSESAAGVWINDIPPERAAEQLRTVYAETRGRAAIGAWPAVASGGLGNSPAEGRPCPWGAVG
jgi:UDPglucose--hexose-1-phosphate uridylyltransferase